MQDRQVVEELDIRVDPRYQRLAASHAVRNVWDVLVELITNSDDSYGRLGQPTQLLIEVDHSQSEKRFVRVADRAEGMLPDELKAKLTWSGRGSYEGESRGFMGRGAKDIVAIGDCLFETIKEGAYSSILLKRGFKAEVHKPRKATDADRERLGVGKRNGTVATVWPGDAQLPRHATLLELLPQHFAIREIFRREDNKVLLVDLNSGEKDTLQFKRPEARLVYRDEYEVDADLFPGVRASFELFRTSEPMESPKRGERVFDLAGILVQSKRAVHDNTFFQRRLENDRLSRHYYGSLKCPFIDELCKDYDEAQEQGRVGPNNPVFLIDPDRKQGLALEHPFTESLYDTPYQVLEEIIEKHRKEVEQKNKRFESKQLRRKLDQLEKLASDFMEEALDESIWGGEGGEPKLPGNIPKQLEIIPSGFSLDLGDKKTLTIRSPQEEGERLLAVELSKDEDCVTLDRNRVMLEYDVERGYLRGNVRVEGVSVCDALVLTAVSDSKQQAEAIGRVLPSRFDRMTSTLEFERPSAVLRLNQVRYITLLAKRELIAVSGVQVHVFSNSGDIAIRGGQFHELVEDNKSGHYKLRVPVIGRRIGAESTLSADLGPEQSQMGVTVRSKDPKRPTGIEITVEDIDLGIFRSRWIQENRRLEIAGRHPSVSRYLKLDIEAGDYIGTDSPHVRTLISEIVAQSVAQRIIMRETEEMLELPFASAGPFYYRHQEVFNRFIVAAHKIMIPDSEAKKLTS